MQTAQVPKRRSGHGLVMLTLILTLLAATSRTWLRFAAWRDGFDEARTIMLDAKSSDDQLRAAAVTLQRTVCEACDALRQRASSGDVHARNALESIVARAKGR